ncbi:MAG: hypothetical protein AB8H80_18200 [Planctomycetota bacterium]
MHSPRNASSHRADPTATAQREQLLEELQLATAKAPKSGGAGTAANHPVTVRPANSIERIAAQTEGTAAISQGRALAAELPLPITVGSFYEITLHAHRGRDITAFARCDQVTMTAEDKFSARLQLLEPLDLSQWNQQAAS